MDQEEFSSGTLNELTSKLNNEKLNILQTLKQIEQRLEYLQRKEEAWLSLEKKVEDNCGKTKQKIKLDVGGKIFSASKDSLLRLPNTYFHALLGSGKWQPDSEGAFFIDRNPKIFDRILDFMRSGKMDYTGLDDYSLEKLQDDCDYYQIEIPKNTMNENQIFICDSFDMETRSSLAAINGKSLRSISGNGWASAFAKTKENGKSFYCEVHVDCQRGPNHVRIGISNSNFTKESWIGQNENSLCILSENILQGFANPVPLFKDAWLHTTIGVFLNVKENFVRFYCNNKTVAQISIPDPKYDWKPTFSVHCHGDQISILGDATIPI